MPQTANFDSNPRAGWIRLTLIPGVGGETQRQLLKAFGMPEAIFSASISSLASVIGTPLAQQLHTHNFRQEVEAALAWADLPGNHLLTLADADYPQALLSSADPPILLYAKGHISLLNQPLLAIVGSRNATHQGEANAEAFAATFSQAGLGVVSGLALGIDAAAHRGALKGPSSTVAVIGTGADRIYPARNADLTRTVASQGCIISEFALGTPPLTANFPRRNRLIAGLALGCLVVEAAPRSGSLITARLAAEAGREVFAIPGSIHAPQSKGCHALIKQGAKLVESAQDVLEELRWETAVAPVATAAADASANEPVQGPEAVLLAALGHDPCNLDALMARTDLTADALLAMLLPLELDRRVAQLPGGLYQRLG